MSITKHTPLFIQPGSDGFATIPDEISCVFRFGKDDHIDQYNNDELIDILEVEENFKQQAANVKLSEAAYHAAITKIKNHLKFSCSLQVHSSDGSLISVFNTEPNQSASSTYTNLETSLELPIGDPAFLQELLDSTSLTTPLNDLDFDCNLLENFPDDSIAFDQLLDFDPTMTIQELTNVPMEQTESYSQQEVTSSLPHSSTHDETSVSSINSPQSDYSEQDTSKRRAAKKSTAEERRLARFGNKQVIKYSDEYHSRRIKNNEAVKKSRMKAKEKQQTSEVQMNKLTDENRMLNDRVDILMKELQVLRSLYKELKKE
ncbi:unnamed protein product [Rotaria magnacalcarata]|uniref:BZIP domain-containing protein n=1 Tax=Rotaria magnacalcarata TaxID=392030 RepID=A0A819PIN3_9BILA|nr:unnamed protein product [Rotaria magnacalcarata]